MSSDRKSWQDVEHILNQLSLSGGATVADLACGPGYFTIPLSKRVGTSGTVYAVDRNEVMIRNLKSNLADSAPATKQNVRVIQSDVCSTSIPANSVDFVIFANVMHDIENKKSFFDEVRKISKSDARIIDIDWHKRETQVGPPLEIRLSENEARKILKENGLIVSHAIDAGPYHYGFVCKLRS